MVPLKKNQMFLILGILTFILGGLLLFFMRGEADILYFNGRIYTLDQSNSVADAFVIRNDRIVGVGSVPWLRLRFHVKKEIDLHGKTVLPAFIDAHCHLLDLGLSKLTVNLEGTQSELEAVTRVAEYVKQCSSQYWIRGMGWDQNLWGTKQFPTFQSLDEVSGEHPVYLTRIDGHACWVNSIAMKIAGISKSTPDPKGGKILRDHSGNPTGVFLDAAMELISNHLPPPTEQEVEQALQKAIDECISHGIATVHDMAIDETHFEIYQKLIEQGKIPIRVYASVDGRSDLWQQLKSKGPIIGYGNNKLTVRAVKYFIDGALGSRGAALREPYTDDPENRGLTTLSRDELKQYVDEAFAHGFQVCLHAIGDRANTIALDVIETVIDSHPNTDCRFRIEHAQVITPEDIARCARLSVIASIQPIQCISDMWWAEARLGPHRVRWMYPWRTFLKAGVRLAGGSDAPIEQINPILGIYAACTRKSLNGIPQNASDGAKYFQLSPYGIVDSSAFENGWYGKERMTRHEAIQCFTTWAAYAGFEEEIKGSIEPGKLADFIILSNDIVQVPISSLINVRVEQTIIGGEVVYQRSQ